MICEGCGSILVSRFCKYCGRRADEIDDGVWPTGDEIKAITEKLLRRNISIKVSKKSKKFTMPHDVGTEIKVMVNEVVFEDVLYKIKYSTWNDDKLIIFKHKLNIGDIINIDYKRSLMRMVRG